MKTNEQIYITKGNTVSYNLLKVFLQSSPVVVALYSSTLNIHFHCDLLNLSGTCIIPGSTPLSWYLCSAVGFICVVVLVTLKVRLGQVGFLVHKKLSSRGYSICDIISVLDVIVLALHVHHNKATSCMSSALNLHWANKTLTDLTQPSLFCVQFQVMK